MMSRTLASLAAGLMSLIGTTGWAACMGPYPGCVYTPASPSVAFAPTHGQAPRPGYGRYHATPEGDPCGRCAPLAAAPVTAGPEEAPAMSDAFFYGGLSGGAGPGIDVAGYGGGGGGLSGDFTGFSAAQAAAGSLSAAYAQSSASAGAVASATAIVIASGSAQGGGGSWGKGPWNGWQGGGGKPGGWNNGGPKPGTWGGGKPGSWGSGGVGGWGHGGMGGGSGSTRHGCGCSARRK